MEPKQKPTTPEQTQNSLNMETVTRLLEEAGIEHIQQTGSILMSLTKAQREALQKQQGKKD